MLLAEVTPRAHQYLTQSRAPRTICVHGKSAICAGRAVVTGALKHEHGHPSQQDQTIDSCAMARWWLVDR